MTVNSTEKKQPRGVASLHREHSTLLEERRTSVLAVVMRVKIMKGYVQLIFYISLIESNFKHKTLHKYHYVLHQYIVRYSSIYKESVIQLVTELMCVSVTPSSNK